VLLAGRSQLSSGERNPKNKEFYDFQLSTTKCKRGQSYISADCDPAYKLDNINEASPAVAKAPTSHEYVHSDLE
jgi:hypothetical protein